MGIDTQRTPPPGPRGAHESGTFTRTTSGGIGACGRRSRPAVRPSGIGVCSIARSGVGGRRASHNDHTGALLARASEALLRRSLEPVHPVWARWRGPLGVYPQRIDPPTPRGGSDQTSTRPCDPRGHRATCASRPGGPWCASQGGGWSGGVCGRWRGPWGEARQGFTPLPPVMSSSAGGAAPNGPPLRVRLGGGWALAGSGDGHPRLTIDSVGAGPVLRFAQLPGGDVDASDPRLLLLSD